MLRIYDDRQLRRLTRRRRLLLAVLFLGGAACGALWSAADSGRLDPLQSAVAGTPLPVAAAPRGCGNAGTGLRLDCSLSLPELPRAEGL